MKKRGSYELECRNKVYLLPSTNGVAKVMFSVVSICLSTGGPLYRRQPGFTADVQTCSTWISWYRDPLHPDMFKLVQLGSLGTGTPSTQICSNFLVCRPYSKSVEVLQRVSKYCKRRICISNYVIRPQQAHRLCECSKYFSSATYTC